MSAKHPKNRVGPEFEVKPSQQELPGAPDPYGRSQVTDAPDPFTQFDAKLPGAPVWGAGMGYAPQLPGAPDPNTGTYAPQLPGAPDPFAGYTPELPGAPEMSVQPYAPELPGAPEGGLHSYEPHQDVGLPELHSYEPQESQEYETVDGFVSHSPHWM